METFCPDRSINPERIEEATDERLVNEHPRCHTGEVDDGEILYVLALCSVDRVYDSRLCR